MYKSPLTDDELYRAVRLDPTKPGTARLHRELIGHMTGVHLPRDKIDPLFVLPGWEGLKGSGNPWGRGGKPAYLKRKERV